MVMIELSEMEKPRTPPPSSFSAPFASPSLRWACKKRLRCFHPDAAAHRRLSSPSPSPSPSPDRLPCRPPPPPPLDGDGPHPRARRAADPFARSSPLGPCPSPSLSPPPPSRRARVLLRMPSPRSEEDYGAEPSGAAPNPSARGVSDETRARDGGASRLASDAVRAGWSLRSAVRNEEEKGKKKRRKVELWVSLSRDEIEDDFLWMTGAKPPRRSKKRDRGASDHFLIGVFPGSWMPNKVTPARYRVSEPSDARKV